ncbi:unnamed protein product [Lactuca virosa]|uniref:Uncharacterized protein n=1 Tax=Lactuca virosa TaxID=75947 RepID=A0AAU9PDJ1_9ASTR|nr:unnamed protein product [Lactuca virosa]
MQSFMMPKALYFCIPFRDLVENPAGFGNNNEIFTVMDEVLAAAHQNKESVFLYKGGNLKTILCFSFVEIGHLHSKFRPTYQKPYNWSRSWTLSLKGSNVKPLENEMMQENMTTAMDICKKIIKDHPTP